MSETLVYILAAIQGVLVIVLVFVLSALNRERKALNRLLRSLGERPLEALLAQTTDSVEAFGHQIRGLERRFKELSAQVDGCLTRIGMVRFDAFPDMGGQLSFAIALIDTRGDGLLIRSLHGRAESSFAFKRVIGGQAEGRILPEEAQALQKALEGQA